ncbi:MAG: hypothetical protein AB7E76_13115 [Deferribacterales bacterium]
MVVNFEGSVINLRDKLAAVDKKRTQSDSSQSVQDNSKSAGSKDSEKQQYIADVIGIRNENKLAASSGSSIKTDEEALDILEQLKKQFMDNSEGALNAHEKASADAVMQFYPFE